MDTHSFILPRMTIFTFLIACKSISCLLRAVEEVGIYREILAKVLAVVAVAVFVLA